MLEQFGDEPTEAEGLGRGGHAGKFFTLEVGGGRFPRDEDQFRFEPACCLVERQGFRRLAAGTEVNKAVALALEDQDGRRGRFGGRGCIIGVARFTAQEGDCR